MFLFIITDQEFYSCQNQNIKNPNQRPSNCKKSLNSNNKRCFNKSKVNHTFIHFVRRRECSFNSID